MKILFCDPGYSESRDRLAPLIPHWEIAACRREEITSNLAGVDVLVPYGAPIGADIIALGSFGLIQQFGVGLETVDVAAATSAGVWVARVPSAGTGNAESVAEHAILLMLALSRKLAQAREALQRRVVGDPAGKALFGKTACIVGLGGVGSALAVRLQSFGMNLIGVRSRPSIAGPSGVRMRILGATDLVTAVAGADYVIVCVTQNASNQNLIDRKTLSAMKPAAMLINVARGGVVDYDALLEALESGQLAAAGLDVFPGEPVDPQHPLLKHNVIATPHIAGVTDVSYDGIAREVARNVERYASGQRPLHAVNEPAAPRGKPKPVAP